MHYVGPYAQGMDTRYDPERGTWIRFDPERERAVQAQVDRINAQRRAQRQQQQDAQQPVVQPGIRPSPVQPQQQSQQASGSEGRGLGDADQASRDIYGATYGQAEQTMEDPVLNQLTQRLEGVMSGRDVPWNDDRISRELTGRADMSAAAAGNQANQLRDWAARMGISPSDPAYQARLQELDATRQQSNQQARGDIGRVATGENYAAQQSAINRAMQERFSRLGLANQQRLTGAGYSAQVQDEVDYQNPNAEIYDLIAQMAMQPQQTVAAYQPRQPAVTQPWAQPQTPQQPAVAPYQPQPPPQSFTPYQPPQPQAPASQPEPQQATPQPRTNWSGSYTTHPQQPQQSAPTWDTNFPQLEPQHQAPLLYDPPQQEPRYPMQQQTNNRQQQQPLPDWRQLIPPNPWYNP